MLIPPSPGEFWMTGSLTHCRWERRPGGHCGRQLSGSLEKGTHAPMNASSHHPQRLHRELKLRSAQNVHVDVQISLIHNCPNSEVTETPFNRCVDTQPGHTRHGTTAPHCKEGSCQP